MSKSYNNGYEFKAGKGEHLGRLSAPLVREHLSAAHLGSALVFDRYSRMRPANEWHPTPSAVNYDTQPQVQGDATVQPQGVFINTIDQQAANNIAAEADMQTPEYAAHDNLGVSSGDRATEVAQLENLLEAPAAPDPNYVHAISDELDPAAIRASIEEIHRVGADA